jgi:hypothetical protein
MNPGKAIILPVNGNQGSKQPRFIREFACHKATEVFLKQEMQLYYVGFSSA